MTRNRQQAEDTSPPEPRRRRVQQALARGVVLLCAVVLLAASPLAMTTTIVPPGEVEEPAQGIVMDYGATASLILPDGRGGMIAYAYGDWDYYAMRRRDWRTAATALFWPTPGTLGRWPLPGPVTEANVRRQVVFDVENLHVMTVDRRRVERLRRRLDVLYEQGGQIRGTRRPNGLSFVHHPTPYSYFHNSNHAVAGWLRELGCQVQGPAVYSRWQVR